MLPNVFHRSAASDDRDEGVGVGNRIVVDGGRGRDRERLRLLCGRKENTWKYVRNSYNFLNHFCRSLTGLRVRNTANLI